MATTPTMNTRASAQEATSWYLRHIDPSVPHAKNVEKHLKGPLFALTLKILVDGQTTNEVDWSRFDEKVYETSLEPRDRARMEGFLASCTLSVPEDPCPKKRRSAGDISRPQQHRPPSRQSSPIITSIQSAVRSSSTTLEYPQFRASELCLRLELYLKTLLRCQGNVGEHKMEPPRAIKARAMSVVRAFVATVGCVKSVQPTLVGLLEAQCMEVLAVTFLSTQVTSIIRRVVSEYAHQVSFASLAFLSSPEDSAEHRLAPLVIEFFQYLEQNWERLVGDCAMELQLSTVLNPRLRYIFKNIEFTSIGHLLEVCEGFSYELQNIEVPPPSSSCVDVQDAMKQAIRDLQREVLTLNGNVLPPVQNRKELVQLLTQTLNSRSLLRRNGGETEGSSPRRQNRRQSFHLSTVDVMTRRLLLASSRTGMGGDAYFIVRDLFGGEEVEVVPSPEQVPRLRSSSIEIVARLSSVTIKCHASFDVYPKALVGDCEPLIQLHTTTTEVVNLQEVRASDSDDNLIVDDDSDDSMSKLVLQEKRTDKTGWRSISIRPALYERVGDVNTPS